VHEGPNASALNTPSHFAAGCGGFHRFSPSGGAAKGIPLKTRTFGFAVVAPATRPASILTCSEISAETLAWVISIAPSPTSIPGRFIAVPLEKKAVLVPHVGLGRKSYCIA
jgi:hypothetical protein